MNRRTTDIAGLVSSRICHDLISPVGAIGNGLELLTLSGGGGGAEISMMNDSVGHAAARIRLFRLAFGLAPDGQQISAEESRAVFADLSRGSRLRYSWEPSEDAERAQARAAYLAVMCIESALAFGGTIAVKQQGNTWQISGTHHRQSIRDDVWDILRNEQGVAEVAPSQVHFLLLRDQVAVLGAQLYLDIDEGRITLWLQLPD